MALPSYICWKLSDSNKLLSALIYLIDIFKIIDFDRWKLRENWLAESKNDISNTNYCLITSVQFSANSLHRQFSSSSTLEEYIFKVILHFSSFDSVFNHFKFYIVMSVLWKYWTKLLWWCLPWQELRHLGLSFSIHELVPRRFIITSMGHLC